MENFALLTRTGVVDRRVEAETGAQAVEFGCGNAAIRGDEIR